ncbi:hypothetical protein yc1106_05627 [Curvularia clavata]|uniref:SET domain-containing protein n=1 Tax=Curvularia clavata TaxID=95742 RepID=A0A9Q9DS79_CURCL|nr:hypothetical protein yc1106_05627 [Curvularia clavata]
MDIYGELLRWAAEQDIEINGIEPRILSNKGTGIIARRDIQVPSPSMALGLSLILDLMQKQKRKFQRDWEIVSSNFSNINRTHYLHSWMVVNTRSFYCTTSNMEGLPHDDRLAILPVADLFNHSDVGCELEFSSNEYTFTADRRYDAGEEVYICYGKHSNDFLLAEYGFVPTENRWDVVCLDDAILPYLNEEQKAALSDKGFLGKYMLSPETVGCSRTRVAMRLLCCTIEEWEQYLFFEAGEDFSYGEKDVLIEILDTFVKMIHQTLKDIGNLKAGEICQRELLVKRWSQIETIVTKAMQNLAS